MDTGQVGPYSFLKSCGTRWRTRTFQSYRLSFERVLAGNFDRIRPADPMPRAGLTQAIKWSRARGEARQRELVGMTAYADAGDLDMPSYLTNGPRMNSEVAASLETEGK